MSYNFDKGEFEEIISKNKNTILYKKISSDIITPVLAQIKISKKFPTNHFLFESAENGNNKGRFSVIGFMPDIIWKCHGNVSQISLDLKNSNEFTVQTGNALKNLRNLIKDSKIDWESCKYNGMPMPSICSGVFGYMSYEIARLVENIPDKKLPDEINIPDSVFVRPQILLVFDNLFDCALICCPVFKDSKESYDDLSEKIIQIEKIIEEPLTKNPIPKNKKTSEFSSNYKPGEYCNVVDRAKDYIVAGDIFQVLPSQRFTADFDKSISEFSFYRALRSINPSPFLFYLKIEDFVLTGSSPEIMVSLKDKKVIIRPLAGTRKRGKDAEEDQKIASELLKNEKEVAEHLMLIDLGRNDVGSVAKSGSVLVTKKMTIENYSHVMHISSSVEGVLRDDLDALDALLAGFPAGTVSGAPKIRAMEIIENLEKVKRSFYAGCVGYFSGSGDMETCITLRSAVIKNDKIYLQAGAGVVFDSDPEMENQECLNKARALMKAYEISSEIA